MAGGKKPSVGVLGWQGRAGRRRRGTAPLVGRGAVGVSLHYAVLGLLSNGSMSGHDLSTTFSRGAGQFWTVNADGVQRSLDRLVEADLVSVEACPEQTYRSTRLGQSVLDDWMASDDEDVPRREVFLLRLSVAAGLGSDEVGVILRARISTMKGRLSTLMRAQKRQRSVEAIFPTELQRVTAEATLEHLIELARAEIDWAGALALGPCGHLRHSS